jgi:superfamily II DNA/RNA helicase
MTLTREIHTPIEQTYKTHYLAVHSGTFPTKESFNMPVITNWFKRNGQSKRYSILDVLKMSAQAKCYIPSFIELDENGYNFISSSLMLFDIDDDDCVTNPQEVLDQLNDICAGLFFTSSHGIKGNRYRLVFQLDAPVRNKQAYKYIFKVISDTLKSYGLPVDEQARDPLQRVRTANKGYLIGNLQAVINTAPILEQMHVETEQRLKEKAEKMKAYGSRKFRIYTADELKEMARAIGYVADHETWFALGYALWSYIHEGHIDEIEGFEIFTILCDGNDESEKWYELRNPREMKIATFIKYAKEHGYKDCKYRYAQAKMEIFNKAEKVKFKGEHIEISFARELLDAEQRVLVKAPTGSGKTFSFINASKELAAELAEENFNRFYLFTAPTIALTEQVAESNDILCVKGQVKDLFQKVKRYIKKGGRVFSVTYDLALFLSGIIEKIQEHCTFTVMVDEVHRLTVDYNFRREAIDNIMKLEQKTSVKSYVALTGTADAVYREPFDREIHVSITPQNVLEKDGKPPCQQWGAVTFEKGEGEALLYQVIKQKADVGRRLLVFIQNKEIIKWLHKKLLDNGINAKAITSDGKSNNMAYHSLVKQSKFPDGVQVILSTSVIADGINIKNESKKESYECIVYTARNSPMFDIDTIRQMAHRYRSTYRSFLVFMQKAQREIDFLYNIEAAYRHDKKIAENMIEELKTEFNGPAGYRLFKDGKIEKSFSVSVDSLGNWTYNKLFIRHKVNGEKAKFYSTYRNQMIEALTKLIGKAPSPTISASALKETIDLSELEDEINELKEKAKLEKKEKMEQISEVFTPNVFKAFKDESIKNVSNQEKELLLSSFKGAVASEHYACIKELANIADYKTVSKIVVNVKNQNQTHAFKKIVDSFRTVQYFERIARKTPTKRVYNAFKKLVGKPLTREEYQVVIQSISGKFKECSLEDARYMAEYFFHHKLERTKEGRTRTLELLTLENIAESFGVTETEVANCLNQMNENESKVFKSIFEIRKYYA